MNKLILIFIMLGLVLPCFAFAQNQLPTLPKDLKGAGKTGGDILKIWGKMADIFSDWWNSYIFPWFKSLWQKIKAPLIKEMERRKPIIKEEFKKEEKQAKEEIKVETSKAGKTLWERFKELIK